MRRELLSFIPEKWIIAAAGVVLAVAMGGVIVWRIFAAGKSSAVADAAVEGLNRAIAANKAAAEAIRNTDEKTDPNNRDTWKS